MAGSYTQDERIGSFQTPLGKDVLVLRRFDGTEAMSELFEYRIEAITEEKRLDFNLALGRNCTLSMKTIDGGTRYFDGILTEVELIGEEDEGLIYRLILRPWLWLLSKTTNCEIFKGDSAPDIIGKVFARHGGRSELLLSRQYPELEYTVQYRESDYNFVRRLMEQHGISFHFRHSEGGHTLVLGDGTLAYDPIPGEKRSLVGVSKQHQMPAEHFYNWRPARQFTTGQVSLVDYNYKRPTTDMTALRSGDATHAFGKLERYDFPGKYLKKETGSDYAQWQLEAARAADGHFHAEGDCISCIPGNLLTLTKHPLKEYNKKYLVLRCTHAFLAEFYRSQSEQSEGGYRGTYEFMDADRPYAPEQVTPKPYVRGPQPAVVVGNGEIDCDEFGAVLVRFFWDRDEGSSIRVRVAQVWASDKWGGVFIPRIGMEVIVDFLEGDPDRPIIIGSVYNGKNMPPFDLPDAKNVSGWKSNSTLGGGGYNEISMDDTTGKELVHIHAQKDMDVSIEHDERRQVGRTRTTDVGVDDVLNVGKDLVIKAGTTIMLEVGMSKIIMDAGSITIESPTIHVRASADLTTEGGGTATHKAGGVMTIEGGMVLIN